MKYPLWTLCFVFSLFAPLIAAGAGEPVFYIQTIAAPSAVRSGEWFSVRVLAYTYINGKAVALEPRGISEIDCGWGNHNVTVKKSSTPQGRDNSFFIDCFITTTKKRTAKFGVTKAALAGFKFSKDVSKWHNLTVLTK